MKTSKIFIALSSVAVIVIAGFFLIQKTQPVKNISPQTTTQPVAKVEWKEYKNIAFGYTIKYPEKTTIRSSAEENTTPIEKNNSIEIDIQGTPTYIEISALVTVPSYLVSPSYVNMRKQVEKWILGTTREYSEDLHQKEVTDQNKYIIKKVSDIKEFTFDTQKAYTFAVHESYPATSKESPIPAPDKDITYIYTENAEGDKLEITYNTNDQTSQEMIKTFSFTNYKTEKGTVNATSGTLQKYTNTKFGISFNFPQNWNIEGDSLVKYGNLRISNYTNPETYQKNFSKNQNKIESALENRNRYFSSGEYPAEKINQQTVVVNGLSVEKFDVELQKDQAFRIYYIPVKNQDKGFLMLTIYGDPANFYVLDDLVKTIEWL